jgi:fibronectin type 3 domain-containing protein/Mg/Co/Ni transporter MgtE
VADPNVVRPVIGVRYFNHQFLRTEDFDVARDFPVDRLRQHDSMLHRPGVIRGLQVRVTGKKAISLSNGSAIDRGFHEVDLAVGAAVSIAIENEDERDQEMPDRLDLALDLLPASTKPAYVTIRRATRLAEPTKDPMVRGEETRIVERARVEVTTQPDPDALVVARIDRNADGEITAPIGTEVQKERTYAGSFIPDGEITTEKIQDGAVTGAKIPKDAITTFHLATDAAMDVDIAKNAVTKDKIMNRNVTREKIETNAVGFDELASSLADDNERAVGRHHIRKLSVTGEKIATDSVDNEHLADDAVREAQIKDEAVTRKKIAPKAVDEAQLEKDAVTGEKLRKQSVGLEHLTDEVRSGLTVGDNGIDSAKLAEADGVTGQDSNVGRGVKTPHLQDEAVTLRKLALEVRAGVAAAFVLFDGIRGVVISHSNVQKVRKFADRAGHYAVTWRQAIGRSGPAAGLVRPGIALSPDILSALTTRTTSLARAEMTALAEAVAEPLVSAVPLPNGGGGGRDVPPARPPAPRNLSAVAMSGTQVNLDWTSGGGTTVRYQVLRGGRRIASPTASAYNDSTTSPATQYAYEVFAVNADGLRSTSAATVTVTTTDTIPPQAPTGLAATVRSDTEVDLTWNAATDNVGVTAYSILRNGVQIHKTSSRSFSDGGVSAGATYRYAIVALDAAGNVSPQSGAVSVVVPDTTAPRRPTSLSGVASSSQVSLIWTASNDNVGVTGYEVLRDGTVVGTSESPAYADTKVEPATTYRYAVVAVDAADNRSEESAAFEIRTEGPEIPPLAPPSGLGAAERDGTVVLEWQRSPDERVAGYIVQRDGAFVDAVKEPAYADTEVRPGNVYTYTVLASDGRGTTSIASEPATVEVIDRTPPTAPTGLTATAIGDTQVNLSWTPSTDDVGVVGYLVFRNGAQIGTATATAFSDTAAPPGSTVRYEIRAVDAAANRSAAARVDVTTPDTVPPNPPTGLTAALEGTAVRLRWTAATDNVGVDRYLVFRDVAQIDVVATPSYLDEHAGAGTHQYFVQAMDAAGNVSASSARASATVPDVTPPTVPANLRVVRNEPGLVEIAWDASDDDVRVSGYRVYRDLVFVVSTADTKLVDNGASANATVRYQVTAIDEVPNESERSNVLEVRTPPPEDLPEDALGPLFAFAYTDSQPRLVHVVSATATSVELQVVDRAGAPADGILNLLAFRPTREEAPLVSLDRIIIDVPGIIDEIPIDPGDLLRHLPIDTLPGIIERIPRDDLPELIPELPPDVIGGLLPSLPDDLRGLIIDDLPDPVLTDVLVTVPREDLRGVITTLPDDRLGTVINTIPEASLGDVVTALPDDRLVDVLPLLTPERVEDVSVLVAPGTLAGALGDLGSTERTSVIASIPETTLGDVLVAAPEGTRTELISDSPPTLLGGTLVTAEPTTRDAILDTASAEKLGEVILAAPEATRTDVVSAIGSETLAETLVAVSDDTRTELATAVPSASLAEAIAVAPEETKTALIDSVSDATLADAVIAASEGTRTELVGTLSDERLGSVVLAAPETEVGTLVEAVPVARVESVIASSPETFSDTLSSTFSLGGRIG